MEPQPVELFYSYAHEDEKLRQKLENHLSLLESQGLIKEWHDRDIKAGDDWETEIDEHLDRASLILLLVSDDFMASRYCYSVEMERALERHKGGEARVIPVILRPVDWESGPFGKLEALPKDGKPVVKWRNRDDAFKSVAQGIRKVLKEYKPKPPTRIFIPRPPKVGFVARRDEQGRDIVARLKEELGPGSGNLITLSGPGGVGKTTLAAEAARSLADDFAARVVWASADGRPSYSLSTLLDDIATQLSRPDLRPLAPEAKKEQVHALVADPPALVVLDNYETVAPAERGGIEEWFTQSRCSSLITSRQKVPATHNIKIVAMSREEAEELLEKLIAETQDPEIFSAPVRQRVYETAEANPFLMEWVVAQIDQAQEPATVFAELAQGEGDAAQRVFDRSFNLPQVGDDGRAALLALSLFSPSASREALAHVSGFGDDPKRLNEAVRNLHALWLVKGLAENSRFTTEGLTRTLAGACLSRDERADEFRQRFIAYFLGYAGVHGQPEPEDYDMLEAEKDNLSGATGIAFADEDWKNVIVIVNALATHKRAMLRMRGYWAEARRLSDISLKAAHSLSDEINVASISNNLALLLHELGERTEARRLHNEALRIYEKLGNQRGMASTKWGLGNIALKENDFAEAKKLYEEALATYKSLKDERNTAGILGQLGMLARNQGMVSEAQRLYSESFEIKKKLGGQSDIAESLHQLAILAQMQGDIVEARRLYSEGFEIKKRLGDQCGIAISCGQLGLLAEEEGNNVEAARLFREALSIFENLGSPYAEIARRDLERVQGKVS